MPTMDSYPAQTTPNDSDYHVVNDGVSGETKKITRTNYLKGAELPTDTVTTAAITNGAVTNAKVASGAVVQVVTTSSSAVATGTTVIPQDDTIPQNTEGNEFMTLAITPKSATNKLVVEATIYSSTDTASRNVIAALFRDSVADSIGVGFQFSAATFSAVNVTVRAEVTAGSISATTFKLRAGQNNTGTLTVNGINALRVFGAAPKSSMKITEYKA